MNLIKWRPMLDPLDEEFERFFSQMPSIGGSKGFVPSLDVYQSNDAVVVETPLAGIDPKNVSISIENDVLTVEGRSEKRSEVDDKEYYMKEVRTGAFHRSITLPVGVDGDKAKAEVENGLLKISIPKSERIKPKTIPIENTHQK